MTKQEYFEFAEKFFAECLEISRRKNEDYSPGANPFGNFTSVEVLGISTETGFVTRMMDKIKRVASLTASGQAHVKEESVTDSLQDLVNYSVLLAGYLKSKQNG